MPPRVGRAQQVCSRLLVITLAVPGAAHAILTIPQPRSYVDTSPGSTDPGIKLPNFNNVRAVANAGCGGAANVPGGQDINKVETPRQAYRRGEVMRVEWKLTIPHPVDVIDTGIRVAIHYGPGDSFAQNVRR